MFVWSASAQEKAIKYKSIQGIPPQEFLIIIEQILKAAKTIDKGSSGTGEPIHPQIIEKLENIKRADGEKLLKPEEVQIFRDLA